MAQLPVEITHSLRFLNDYIHTSEKILAYAKKTDLSIKSISATDEKYGNKLRKLSRDAVDDIDEMIGKTEMENQILNTEMTDIISKKHSEEVIYALHNYDNFYDKYDDLCDDYEITIKKIEIEKDQSAQDKDFIRAIAYNKVLGALYKASKFASHIYTRLGTLLGKK